MTDKKNTTDETDKKPTQPAPVSKDGTSGGSSTSIIKPKNQR